jgi:hypothetical protein
MSIPQSSRSRQLSNKAPATAHCSPRSDTGETLLVRFRKLESEVIKVMASERHLIERMRQLVGEIELRQSTRCVMFGFATSVREWTHILARSQKQITYRRSST